MATPTLSTAETAVASRTRRISRMPAWARWSFSTAAGVLLLAIVQSFDETDRLTSTSATQLMLRWGTPILLAGLGGLFAERAGVVNIGLEGMMILGTWFGAWGAVEYGAWWGILLGALGGAIGGLLHAIATVSFGVDHIVSGVAINILAPGATRFLSSEVFANMEGGSITESPSVPGHGKFTMPFLAGGDLGSWSSPDWLGSLGERNWPFVSDVAELAKGLLTQVSYVVIIALALVPLSAWVLWRTRFGLRLRVCGEMPLAGESQGVDIYRYKYIGIVISGALAGLAGAFIASPELGSKYSEGQTNGRGFIGLASLIFGNWRPSGILGGAMLFGYPFGIGLRDREGAASHALLLAITVGLVCLAAWSWIRGKRVDTAIALVLAVLSAVWYFASDSVPDWWINILPFVIVLVVLVFFAQRLRMPAADGQRYRRGGT